MKLSIKEGSENYVATVIQIENIYPIEGADKIQRAVIFGNDVVIGKNTKIGDKMIYFCSGTKLNPVFCSYNNLLTDASKNKDLIPGYISHKQFRVKAVKLRGIISDGILLPISSLDLFKSDFKPTDLIIGDAFTDIGDINICEKYIVPAARNSNPGGHKPAVNKFDRLIDNQFYLHNDTENLRKNIGKINPNDIIGIHYKKHGTSAVFANIPTKKLLKWWEKLLVKLGVKIDDKVYDIIYSSRKVIKNKSINPDTNEGYYGEDIWGIIAKELDNLQKIPKNWTLYGEIIGYLPSGGFIQKDYDYDCDPGYFKFYVYKISIVNPDGKVIYLTDKQIEEYCEKVGLLYKDTFIYYGKAYGLFSKLDKNNHYKNLDLENWQQKFLFMLEREYNEKDCYMCTNKVPEEGIALRVEKLESYQAYKLKSKRFILMESESQEKEEINIEDNQDE